MTWPLSQDYNEAIQESSSFSDPELRQGEVVCNAMGIPMPRSGNFADVYELRSTDGRTRWAVKCFTRQVVGLRERYSEISKHLRQLQLPFMVDFQYLEQGIRVRGQWYPVLKMHWVEGFLLNHFVRENLDKPALLTGLGQIWLRMAQKLRESKLAHCDLQHGNVILVPGSKTTALAVKLIDYDGLFVPTLAGTKSGEVGHPSFQHPQRLQTGAYHAEVDRFALLVIATALQGLAVAGRSLWDRYDNGDNLLFRQGDFQNPSQSPLFADLLRIQDSQTHKLAITLQQACGQPLETAPLLDGLFPKKRTTGITTPAPASAASTATTVAARGQDWDFAGGPSEGPSKLRRSKEKEKRGIPAWAWALGGAGAASLLMVGGLLAWQPWKPAPSRDTVQQTSRPAPKPTQVGPQLALNENPEGPKKTEPDKTPPSVPMPDPPQPDPQRQPAPQSDPAPAGKQADRKILHVAVAAGTQFFAFNRQPANFVEMTSKSATAHMKLPNFEGHTSTVLCMDFCSDGKRMVTGSADNTLRVWEIYKQQPIYTLEGHSRPVTGVAVSPDGRRAVSTDGGPEVFLWNLETGKEISTITNPRGVRSLAFSAKGDKIVCGLDDPNRAGSKEACYVWNVVTRAMVLKLEGNFDQEITAVALSPDERLLVLGGYQRFWTVQLGRLRTGTLQTTPQPHPVGVQAGAIHRILFARDGKHFLVSAQKGIYLSDSGGALIMGRDWPDKDLVTACFDTNEQKMFVAYSKGTDVHDEMLDIPGSTPVVVAPPPPPPPPPNPRRRPRPRPGIPTPPEIKRLAVPSRDELAAARKKVRQDYKNDFAGVNRQQMEKLVTQLIQEGGRNTDVDPTYHYALLREGFDLACKMSDLGRAWRAASEMARFYELRPLADRATAVLSAASNPGQIGNGFTMERAIEVSDEAIAEDEFGRAGRLLDVAQQSAQALRSTTSLALIQQRRSRLTTLQREYKLVEPSAKKLVTDPDDGPANLAMGKLLCFRKGDWERGLRLLQKGSDQELANLAMIEAGAVDDPRIEEGIGNSWWDRAAKEMSQPVRDQIQEHARSWYRRALVHMEAGTQKDEIEKRLTVTALSMKLKPGLVAELFTDTNLGSRADTRIVYQVTNRLGDQLLDERAVDGAVSVRWKGWLLPPEPGHYNLQVSARGGVRLMVDSRSHLDRWFDSNINHSFSLDLSPGPHSFQIEYCKRGEPTSIQLFWHRPNGKGGVLPMDILFHDRQQEKGLPGPKDRP